MGTNSYFNRRTRKWAPTSYRQRQYNSEMVGAHTDYQIRKENKKRPEKGSKMQFLEAYETIGYEAAKEQINARFGKEVFTDEIIIDWLGLKKKILEAYKKGTIKSAYEKACKINEKLSYQLLTDKIIMEWFEFKENILDAYKKGKVEDAYKKADEINKEVGYPLVKKEYIDKWIEEERKKESKEANQENTGENDGSR